jgi:hypothetical protein
MDEDERFRVYFNRVMLCVLVLGYAWAFACVMR